MRVPWSPFGSLPRLCSTPAARERIERMNPTNLLPARRPLRTSGLQVARLALGAAQAAHRPHRPVPSDKDDPTTPLEETLRAFEDLVRAGKVRAVGASNDDAARLAEALRVSDANGLTRFATLQPEFNLVARPCTTSGVDGRGHAGAGRRGVACTRRSQPIGAADLTPRHRRATAPTSRALCSWPALWRRPTPTRSSRKPPGREIP
jgi:hypothetical protein